MATANRAMQCARLLIASALIATPATAQEAPVAVEKAQPRAVQPAVTIGLLEPISLSKSPERLGAYVAISLDVGFVLSDKWMLIPSAGFEFSPELGNWGATFFLILDRFLTQKGNVTITLEPQVGVVHDAARRAEGGVEHALFLSAGVGVAFVTARGTIIPQLSLSVGVGGEGWSASPMLLFSAPF